jgi:hypothetical protein
VGGVGAGWVGRADLVRLGFSLGRNVGPTHQATAANASPNGSVSAMPRHRWPKFVNQCTLEATNANMVDFCDFNFFWLFCKLRDVMWCFFGINSF